VKRSLRPPSAISVAPIIISQVNCEASFGRKPWRFLGVIVEHNIAHRRKGKLVLVEASTLLAHLAPPKTEPETVLLTASADDEAARVLAVIGRRRA
jgi:hypothetical protein